MSLAQLGGRLSGCSRAGDVGRGGFKLVHKRVLRVDQLVDDLHEGGNRSSTGLVDLFEDLGVLDAFLEALDDLIIPDADAGVSVREEPVGVAVKLLVGPHGDTAEIE